VQDDRAVGGAGVLFGMQHNGWDHARRHGKVSERSEHSGVNGQLKSFFGMFRNPPAHTPRATAEWTISEADTLDYFSWLFLLHRRLDKAIVNH
jgi:hypothetical protein